MHHSVHADALTSRVRARLLWLLAVSISYAAGEQGKVLAPGDPPLTDVMVRKLAATMAYLLDAKLTDRQQERFRRGIIGYWKSNDRAAILQVIRNLKYADQKDELTALRNTGQKALVNSLRLDTLDDVSAVLVEAYDAAHAGGELIGTWKRTGATDSGQIEIAGDGRITHIRVRNDCGAGNGCCRVHEVTEHGILSPEGLRLAVEIKSARETVRDGCAAGASREGSVAPRKERVTWWLRPGAEKGSPPSICWTTKAGEPLCYAKQP